MEAEGMGGGGPVNLGELLMALEQATLMAKQIPTTADPNHLRRIYSALHSAHLRLSSFLSHLPPPCSAADNSVSGADMEDADMQVVGEENSTVEEVGERIRDGLFIRNKRPKRPLSPSAAAHHHQSSDYEFRAAAEYLPLLTKQRALDLVFQFHG